MAINFFISQLWTADRKWSEKKALGEFNSLRMKRKNLFHPTELYGLLRSSVKYQTKEFFNNSTLHGVRYIAEKGRAFGEKFMWFCFVSIGAVAAFVIIGSLWEKFQTNPTITGTNEALQGMEKNWIIHWKEKILNGEKRENLLI